MNWDGIAWIALAIGYVIGLVLLACLALFLLIRIGIAFADVLITTPFGKLLPQFSLRRYRALHPDEPALAPVERKNFGALFFVQAALLAYSALDGPGAWIAAGLVLLWGVIHLIYALVEPNAPSGTSFGKREMTHPLVYWIHLGMGLVFASAGLWLMIARAFN